MKKLKIKLNIGPRKILKFYYVLLFLGLIFSGYKIFIFLDKNVYQAIFWSQNETDSNQVYTVEEDVNIKQFEDAAKAIQDKIQENKIENFKNIF